MTSLSLQDLQLLLQSTLGDQLSVASYTSKDLLPPGENYGSKMLSLHVVIKNSEEEKSKDLYLVAKSPPPIEMRREIVGCSVIFKKEIFVYSKLIPFYRKLEIENGVKEEEALNMSPMCYGSKLSLNPDNSQDFDAVILLENLKPKGYYCVDRKYGCGLAHATLAVKTMARFHALGMAVKEKAPEFFEVMKIEAEIINVADPEGWESLFQQRVHDVVDDSEIKEYFEACRQASTQGVFKTWKMVPSEPWSTIIHADFWTNNMMYRDNSEGEPDDIKLVDFQTFLFLNPLRELTFFVASELDHDTVGHVDELIDLYYDTLIERLKILNCNIEPYSRKSFDELIREAAYVEFMHCLMMVRVVTLGVDANADGDDANLKILMESNAKNEIYTQKLRDMVQMYGRKGWFKT